MDRWIFLMYGPFWGTQRKKAFSAAYHRDVLVHFFSLGFFVLDGWQASAISSYAKRGLQRNERIDMKLMIISLFQSYNKITACLEIS
jgi:hypothetical protein